MVDSNTLVFLHFDNDVCKDECGHTFTSSNILLESNHKKVGTHSAYFHDAGTLYCDKPGFSIGGADFTIDFWVYVTSIGRYSRIYNVARSSSWIECMCNNSGANKGTATDYSIRMHGDSPTTPAWAVAKLDLCSKWTHYALVYEHSKTKRTLYIDGKAVLVSYHEVPRDEVISIELMNNMRRECNRPTTGYMDEFRISSCARWTSDFTPPTNSDEYTWGGQKMNFNNVFPYNQIHEATIDGQRMIWFPKTYVRAENLYDGRYRGKYAWQVSEYPRPGFHVHRAFIDSAGHERNGFWLGKYEASNQNGLPASVPNVLPWVNISTKDAISKGKLRNSRPGQSGWHIQNCFEYWYVSLIMMIELGTPDFCTKIGMGGTGSLQKCGTTNAVWRGLYEHWANAWEIVDGCRTDANKVIQLWDRTGEHYVSTGKVLANAGIARGSVSGIYFSDAFLPVDDGSKSTFFETLSDGVGIGANSITLLGGSFYEKGSAGGFTFWAGGWNQDVVGGQHVGFRLAKY